MKDDTTIWPTLLELTGCLASEFEGEDFCFIGVLHGQQAPWDYGLDGGMAWVRLTDSYQSSTFPERSESLGCAEPLAFGVEVGAIRCAPVPDEAGALPTVEDQEDFARLATADMSALRRAIQCCLGKNGQVRFRRVEVGDFQPIGPQGGVGGGVWTLTTTGE